MKFLKKFLLISASMSLIVTSVAIAQTASSQAVTTPSGTGTLIADVNIEAVVATTTNGVLSGSFLVKSSFGSQEGVVYGLVARSKTDGRILDTAKGEGALMLPEGASVSQNFSYTLPTFLPEAADVFLTLYTPTGITLAVHKVAEVPKGNATAVCTGDEDGFACTSGDDATLTVSVFAGSPQGATVAERVISLSTDKKVVLFADLTKDLKPGMYVISGTVTEEGRAIGKVFQEFAKPGLVAKIMSISAVNKAADGTNKVSATVYAVIVRYATSSAYILSMTSPGCGEAANVTVTKPVTELVFDSSCENGQLTVNLLENGNVVDSATSTFTLPLIEKNANYSLIGWGVLVLAMLFLVWFVLRRFATGQVATTAVFLLMVAGGVFVVPTPASAATQVINGSYFFLFCTGTCGSINQDGGSILAQATITYPSSVPANTQYTISLSQSATDATNYGICLDYAGEDKNCHNIDVKTDVSLNGVSYAGTATHVASVNYTPTAAASGNITFGATVNPYAPNYIGCDPVWLSPTTKCSMGVDSSENSMSATIPIVAAPTVNIYFSFLNNIKEQMRNMFTAFAAER